MNRLLIVAGFAMFSSAAAIAQTADKPGHKSPAPGVNSETMSAVKDSTAGMVGTISSEMTHSTDGFVTAAATSDMYEVTAGKVALQRSQSAGVKTFC
jgi:putative membrane protein